LRNDFLNGVRDSVLGLGKTFAARCDKLPGPGGGPSCTSAAKSLCATAGSGRDAFAKTRTNTR
jgi:hypothetical protein